MLHGIKFTRTRYIGRKDLQKRVLNKKQYDNQCSDKEYSMKDETEQTKIQAHILKKKDHCRTF